MKSAAKANMSRHSEHRDLHDLSSIETNQLGALESGLYLYRYEIPADLINITQKASERSETVKIFKKKIVQLRNDAPSDAFMNVKKLTRNVCIKKEDSLNVVNFLLESTIKEHAKKKKEKLRGSMYVNEFWGRQYEKGVLKSTQIDKELKKENNFNRRPLGEKYRDLNKIYEKKRMNATGNTLLSLKTSFTELRPQDSVALRAWTEPEADEPDFMRNVSTVSSAKVRVKLVKREAPRAKLLSLANTINKAMTPTKPYLQSDVVLKERSGSMDETLRSSVSSFRHYKPGLKVNTDSDRMMTASPELPRCSPLVDREYAVSSYKSMRRTTLGSSTAFVGHSKIKEEEERGSVQENRLARGSYGNSANVTPVGLSTVNSGTLKKGERLISPKVKLSMKAEGRKSFLKESNNIVGQLLGRCDTELDEVTDCMKVISGMQDMLDEKEPKGKFVVREKRKMKVIEDCIYMLGKRNNSCNSKIPQIQ